MRFNGPASPKGASVLSGSVVDRMVILVTRASVGSVHAPRASSMATAVVRREKFADIVESSCPGKAINVYLLL